MDEQVAPEGGYRESAAPELRFVVERRWFGHGVWPLALFCLVWDGGLFLILRDRLERGDVRAVMFSLLHVAAGVALTYAAIGGFLNRTRIAIERGTLSVTHGPLPWLGDCRVGVAEIRDLRWDEHRTKKGGRTLSLRAMRANGKPVSLLDGLVDEAQAIWLRSALAERLGLVESRRWSRSRG